MRRTSDGPAFPDHDDVELPDDAREMGTYASNSPQIPVGRHARSLLGRIKRTLTDEDDRT